jgi:OOP family OmpA-OmpF porin
MRIGKPTQQKGDIMFLRLGKMITVAGLGLGLGACAQFYDAGMSATSNGPAFNDALTANYQKLAKMEADEQDWTDADFFGQRALQTAGGDAPGPQAIADRDLPAEHLADITAARALLVSALDGGARESNPAAAAQAQAGFDCWMQEAEENIQPKDIKWCRDWFWDGMNALEVKAPAPKPMPAPAMGPWIVYFPFDSSEITYEGQLEINKAEKAASKLKGSQMLLTAHTDTSGAEQYNLDLSARRAKAVVDTLELIGVSRDGVTASAVGESDPAVDTGDGVREQKNRRVEIRLTK